MFLYGYSFISEQDIADFIHIKNDAVFKSLILKDPNLCLVLASLYKGIFHSILSYNSNTVVYIVLSDSNIFVLKTIDYSSLIELLHKNTYSCQIYSSSIVKNNGVYYRSKVDYTKKYNKLGKYPVFKNNTLSTKIVTGNKKKVKIFGVSYESVSDAARKLNIRQQKLNDLVLSYSEGKALDDAVLGIVKPTKNKKSCREDCIYFHGNAYESIAELARDQLGVYAYSTSSARIRMTISRILNNHNLSNKEKEQKLEEFFSYPHKKREFKYKGFVFDSVTKMCKCILGSLYSYSTVQYISTMVSKYENDELDYRISSYFKKFIQRRLNNMINDLKYHVVFEYEVDCIFYFSLVSEVSSFDEIMSSEEIVNYMKNL